MNNLERKLRKQFHLQLYQKIKVSKTQVNQGGKRHTLKTNKMLAEKN